MLGTVQIQTHFRAACELGGPPEESRDGGASHGQKIDAAAAQELRAHRRSGQLFLSSEECYTRTSILNIARSRTKLRKPLLQLLFLVENERRAE